MGGGDKVSGGCFGFFKIKNRFSRHDPRLLYIIRQFAPLL